MGLIEKHWVLGGFRKERQRLINKQSLPIITRNYNKITQKRGSEWN